MKTWFIADTHFGHKNVLEFENRPFDSIEEMEDKIIEAWNSVVAKNDKVYMLGDFCFGGISEWIRILEQLKGEIHLIKGNHDKGKIIDRLLRDGYLKAVHYVGEYIKLNHYQLHLTHYPLGTGERPFLVNIHGHIHSLDSNQINQFNVGVDSQLMRGYQNIDNLPFGTPIDFDTLMSHIVLVNEIISAKYKKGE